VDFAAPTGTPIRAAGSGVVVYAGWFSSFGKYVRIRHNNTFDTAYAHMHNIRPTTRVGASVRQGDIIGYVGTTGRSTGPHLHYELLKNGQQVNPKSVLMASNDGLAGRDFTQFKNHKQHVVVKLAQLREKKNKQLVAKN
jgi:murein DD-endopeptidase MepM/ murein hydrolase activator NlpD